MRGLRSSGEQGIIGRVSSYGYPHCPYCGGRVLKHGAVCGNCAPAAANDPLVIASNLKADVSPRQTPAPRAWHAIMGLGRRND